MKLYDKLIAEARAERRCPTCQQRDRPYVKGRLRPVCNDCLLGPKP